MPAKPAADRKSRALHKNRKNRCFGCGEGNDRGLKLRFRPVADAPLGTVEARARIPRRFTGAPTFLHGGIVATLLDEAMAKVNAQLGVTAVTHRLEVEYRRPVPPSTRIVIAARHRHRRSLRIYNEAEVRSEGGEVLARGRGRFVVLPRAVLERRLKVSSSPVQS